jgi:hypothetical protein
MLRIKDQVQAVTATRNAWDLVYRPLLSLLLIAKAPLTARQLAAFAAIDDNVTAAVGETCEAALLRLGQFLTGHPDAGYQYFHSSVADYVSSAAARASLHCNGEAAHRQITEHGLSRHYRYGSWKAADPYLRKFLGAVSILPISRIIAVALRTYRYYELTGRQLALRPVEAAAPAVPGHPIAPLVRPGGSHREPTGAFRGVGDARAAESPGRSKGSPSSRSSPWTGPQCRP